MSLIKLGIICIGTDLSVKMASFAPAQAEIRSKWGELVETSALGVASDVSSGVKSVVGWLKQVQFVL